MNTNRFKCYRLRKKIATRWRVELQTKTVFVPSIESKEASTCPYIIKLVRFYNYQIQLTL